MAQDRHRVVAIAWIALAGVSLSCAGSGGTGDCSDGVDNDGDGLIDDQDPGCTANGDAEAPDPFFPACGDSVDNDGDGLIDTEDPGCEDLDDPDEYNEPIAKCRDGIDNDGDGHIDYPNDPGCRFSLEDDESDDCPDGPNCPQCSNGIDDDGDGFADYPDDLGCNTASDPDEFNSDPTICGANVPLTLLPSSGTVTGNATGLGPNELISLNCGGSGSEMAFQYTVTEPRAVQFTTNFPETTLDTVIYVRDECRETATELGCNDDDASGNSTLFLDRLEIGEYYIIVDAFNPSSSGDFKLTVTDFTARGDACTVASDDCAPGLVCRKLTSAAAVETCELPECSDGLNNEDDDAFIDFPDEPGCESPEDNDESDVCPSGGACPECSNGADDDGDGIIDYPLDPGCFFAADISEIDECIPGVEVIPLAFASFNGDTTNGGASNFDPSCAFGGSSPEDIYAMVLSRDLLSITFDTQGSTMDTITSVRLDTCDAASAEISCSDPGSGGEAVTINNPAQGNYFVFVDGNFSTGPYVLNVTGVIPAGDSCSAGDTHLVCQSGFFCNPGTSLCEVAQCNDGLNNDADAEIDFPNDPGCESPSDNTELDTCPNGTSCPQCSNQTDDDGDGLIDFGSLATNDLGCAFAADDNELDCEGESDPVELLTVPSVSGTTVGLTGDFNGSCGGSGPEAVYVLNSPGMLRELVIDTLGSALDTVLYVKQTDCSASELACNDQGGGAFGNASLITLQNAAAGQYMIFVDTFGSANTYNLNVKGVIAGGQPCDPTQVLSGLMECESGFFCNGSMCAVAACNDGVDDDGDGDGTRFPDDPGCDDPSDNDETDDCPAGPGCPQCANGSDDDGDAVTDFPDDPGCVSASDTLELDPCAAGVPIALLTDSGTGGMTPAPGPGVTSNFNGSCNSSTSSTEDVYAYENTRDLVTLSFSTVGSVGDTVLYARGGGQCSNAATELDCLNIQNGGEQITINSPAQDTFFVFVDGDFVSGIPYVLEVSGTLGQGASCSATDVQFVCGTGLTCQGGSCQATQCNDGISNDGDGLIDAADPGCESLDDNSEAPNPNPLPECADGIDNDGDNLIDFPDDTGCSRAADDLELDCADLDPIVTVTASPTNGNTSGASNDFTPSCSASSSAPELVHQLTFPGALDSLTVNTNGSSFDTIMYIKSPTCADADIGCDDDGGDGLQSQITLANVAAGTYFVMVDGFSTSAGPYILNVAAVITAGQPCDADQIASGMASCGGGTVCTSGTCQ